jgi:hypothetical protein
MDNEVAGDFGEHCDAESRQDHGRVSGRDRHLVRRIRETRERFGEKRVFWEKRAKTV